MLFIQISSTDYFHLIVPGRLFPKNVNNECRIISGNRVTNPCNKKSFNGNFRYITLNNALRWLIRDDPSLIGFACAGHRDIQAKYSHFLSLNSLHRSFNPDKPPTQTSAFKKWNFLKSDIQKCFDSIDIKDLIAYVSDLFAKRVGPANVLTLVRYCSVQFDVDKRQLKPRFDYLTVRHNYHEKGFLYGVADLIEMLEAEARAREGPARKVETGGGERMERIVVPLSVHDRNVTLGKLDTLLRKCLEHVMIKIHGDIYERMNGILQGG